MLIEFTVGNYRSFKEPVTLSMVAANLVSQDKSVDENNVFAVDEKLSLLKSAAIYGANASGKSNLAKALNFMVWFMVNSSRETQSTDAIGVEPFLLSTETESQPSFFELVFLIEGQKYRYGFEATSERVVAEWLYTVPKSRETNLFDRDLTRIKSSKVLQASGIEPRTRPNALFLSVCAQFNVAIVEKILAWLTKNLQVTFGFDKSADLDRTISKLESNLFQEKIVQLVKNLDLSITDIKVTAHGIDERYGSKEDFPEEFTLVHTIHKRFDKANNYNVNVNLLLEFHESEGTRKIFALAGTLIDVLAEGSILVIDELDAKLHPLITRSIIELFNRPKSNPNNAQLIFMTHD
ncbi:MAG: ATP-binding protein, partial [Alkalinema sp. CAN_BIN05]|nr:ATP-binding protein [Alkalinema sp. CAN_BIN05]